MVADPHVREHTPATWIIIKRRKLVCSNKLSDTKLRKILGNVANWGTWFEELQFATFATFLRTEPLYRRSDGQDRPASDLALALMKDTVSLDLDCFRHTWMHLKACVYFFFKETYFICGKFSLNSLLSMFSWRKIMGMRLVRCVCWQFMQDAKIQKVLCHSIHLLLWSLLTATSCIQRQACGFSWDTLLTL